MGSETARRILGLDVPDYEGGSDAGKRILGDALRPTWGQQVKSRAIGTAAYLGNVLDRPGAAVRNVIEGIVEDDLQKGIKEAAFNLVPFGETITGKERDPALGKTILEKAGVGELGSIDLPIFGEVTGRGTLGLGMDILADPTLLIPGAAITKGLGKAGKGVGAGLKKAREFVPESVKEVAAKGYEAARPALQKTIGVGFNPELVKLRQVADATSARLQKEVGTEVLNFVRGVAARGVTPDEAKLILPLSEFTPELRLRLAANPDMEQSKIFQAFMRQVEAAVPDPLKRQVLEDAANEAGAYFRKIHAKALRAGIEEPELGSGLLKRKEQLEKELESAMTQINARRNQVRKEVVQRIRVAETGLDRLTRAQERLRAGSTKAETSMAIAEANIELDDFRKAVMQAEIAELPASGPRMVLKQFLEGPLAKKLSEVFADIDAGVEQAFKAPISKVEDLEAALGQAKQNQTFQFVLGTLRQSQAKGGPVVDAVTKRLQNAFEVTRRQIVGELSTPIKSAEELAAKIAKLKEVEKQAQKEVVKNVVGIFDQKRLEMLRELKKPVRSLEELSYKIGRIKALEMGPQRRLVDSLRANLAERIGRIDQAGFKRISNIQAKMHNIDQTLEFLPAYVTHVATPEAIEALVKRGPGFGSKLRNPTHSSMLMRKWIDGDGRPLSLIEVDDIIQGRSRMAASEKLAPFAEGENKYFDVDPVSVMFIRGKRYSRAVSGKEFLEESGRLFGEKVPDNLLEAATTKVEREAITKRWVRDQVDQGAFAVEQPLLKGTVFRDPAIAGEIDRLYEGFVNEEVTNKLLQVFDSAQGYFKRNVLFLAPAYFTRNLLGGIWNTWLSSGNPISMAKSYNEALDVLRHAPAARINLGRNVVVTGDELYDAWSKRGALSVSQYILESPRVISAEAGQIMKAQKGIRGKLAKAIRPTMPTTGSLTKQAQEGLAGAIETGTFNPVAGGLNPFRTLVGAKPYDAHFSVIRAGQEFAQFSDEWNRMATGLEALKQGIASGLTKEQAIAEAAETILKFQFDFSRNSFTQFENNVMRRVFPFYAWTRRSVPLQFWAAAHTPGRFALPSKVVRASNTEIDEDVLPEYLIEGTPIRAVNDKDGNPQFLYGLGLPLEDLNRLMLKGAAPDLRRTLERIGADINPFARTIMEQWTGRNLYFGQDIAEVNQAPAGFRFLPNPVKDMIRFREVSTRGKVNYTMSPTWLNFMMNDPTGFSRFIMSVSKLTDPRKGMDSRVLNALTGGKLKSIDVERELVHRENEALTALGRKLRLEGEPLKSYTNVYLPKGETASPEVQALLDRMKRLAKRQKELKKQ